MITYFLLSFLVVLFNAFTSWMPVVSELPFGSDAFLVNGVGYYRRIAEDFPPMTLMLNLAMIYIGFKITMLLLKILLAGRVAHKPTT